jgi:hypothetical protein
MRAHRAVGAGRALLAAFTPLVPATLLAAATLVAAVTLLAAATLLATAVPARATAPYARKYPPFPTRWTGAVSSTAPLPQYPRPQLQRAGWLNLNGRWQFEAASAGQAPPFGRALAQTILVPFPVQSPLSGIEQGIQRGWYRRTFAVPKAWRGQRVVLNFGAVSWSARVYVNGRLAGAHRGDYTAFSLDITRLLRRSGPNELIVGYDDPIGAAGEPVGKQIAGEPYGIFHTASSGIWQTVWLEPVAPTHLAALDLVPDLPHDRLTVTADVARGTNATVIADALSGGRVVASARGRPGRPFSLAIAHPRLWSPSSPYLYGLRVRVVRDGTVADRVRSYFGMRSITLGSVDGATRILLNGKFVFESGALDQGYWPDGLYTPPTDGALRLDIEAAKRFGYNMLREHAKVQSARWYYWADKLGILVWQDMPSMPIADPRPPTPAAQTEFRRELAAVVVQHRSDPSIVTWIPFNEGWGQFDVDAVTEQVKALDPASLVDSDSGSADCCAAIESADSDIRDSHAYFGPYAISADDRASAIGEYGGVLPYPPVGHRWPGVLTSIGSPALVWSEPTVIGVIDAQYQELAQQIFTRGLSAAVFTELASYEQELGILSYDRDVSTIPPAALASLNSSLIAASQRPLALSGGTPQPPPGMAGLWSFDEGQGTTAADSSGGGETLTLQNGAGWTAGVGGGSALSITAAGQYAESSGPAIDTRRSFTVSAWLHPSASGESGTAVSEGGTDGSSFSLGIDTGPQGAEADAGLVAQGKAPDPGNGTWWTFVVPSAGNCTAASCGTQASLRYDDARSPSDTEGWHEVVGVWDADTQTISLYVDGVPEDVEHVAGVPAAGGPLLVGEGLDDYAPTDAFLGAIDQVRTYARALTPAEVWQLYSAERP